MSVTRAESVWSKKATFDADTETYTFSPHKNYDRWDVRLINLDAGTNITWTIEVLDKDGHSVEVTDAGSRYTTNGTGNNVDVTFQSTHCYQVKVTLTLDSGSISSGAIVKANAYSDLDAAFNDYGSAVAAA